jgi:hypothetical protein
MSSDLSSVVSHEQLQSSTVWPAPPKEARWRENPERLAWLVILTSFAVFLVLAVTVPLTVAYVMRYATVSQPARLEPILGTLLLYPSAQAEAMAITAARNDIVEGNRIVAGDDSTQGTLGLVNADNADVLLGSVQIYPGTIVDVLRIRKPLFKRSPEPYQVRLRLEKGQARIFTITGEERPLRVELETPHGVIDLAAGTYQVTVDTEQTDVTVRSGWATLQHEQEKTLIVPSAERAWISAAGVSQETMPAEQNLIQSGDFSESMLDAWQSELTADNVTPGEVRVRKRDGRRVAHFSRNGEDNVHTEVAIRQDIDKNVNVYDSLTLQLDVRLLHQSLPGAGYLSSEYPLRVELSYTDIYGNGQTWGHGFYFRDPENENWPILDGEKIPPYTWYTYQSPNLMEALDTRPAHINSIRIYASGWNYQSMVSEVYLLAE